MTDDTLFTSAEVAGCTIQPWTLGQIKKLMPTFERLAVQFKTLGVAPKDVLQIVKEDPFKVLTPCVDELGIILSITTGKTVEEVEGLHLREVVEMTLVIIHQNIEYLKNSLGPVLETVKRLTAI